jgi:hypothetical protein
LNLTELDSRGTALNKKSLDPLWWLQFLYLLLVLESIITYGSIIGRKQKKTKESFWVLCVVVLPPTAFSARFSVGTFNFLGPFRFQESTQVAPGLTHTLPVLPQAVLGTLSAKL